MLFMLGGKRGFGWMVYIARFATTHFGSILRQLKDG
tara:strand:+ start:9315 stop:9422 length:108 start_codon:yes stop_codon:yes gene_type:complete